MKTFWKKAGWTCMTFLPLLISILAQLGLGIILSMIFTVQGMVELNMMAEPDMNILMEYVLEQTTKYSGMMIFGYHIIALFGFGIWYYLGCGRPKMTNPIKKFTGKSLASTVVLSFGLCFFANAFVLVGQYIFPRAIERYMELMEAAGLGVDTYAIIASILIAPIGEELLCRGLTYHYAKKVVADVNNRRVAFWIANCLQALAFGIMHLNLVQGIYAFILGLGLGWLRERYKSLYPAILAHAIINFSSTYLVGYPISLLPEAMWSYLLLMIVSIAVTAAGYYLGKEHLPAETTEAAEA